MPGEKSLHRKIQLVLDQANSSEATSLGDLADRILNRQIPNFQTFQYDSEKDAFSWRPSIRVIKRAIILCHQLGLLDEKGRLTTYGKQAARKAQFDLVLSDRVRRVLVHDGVAIGKLNEAIEASLRSDPPILPTAKSLWAILQPNLNAADFSRFLTLLSHCGAAQSSQAKVYLRLDTR